MNHCVMWRFNASLKVFRLRIPCAFRFCAFPEGNALTKYPHLIQRGSAEQEAGIYVATSHSLCLHRGMDAFNPMAASRAVAAETDAALHH